MSLKRLEKIIVGQDMYGHVIGVHYRGRGSYQTRLGAFFTFATYVLMIVNLVTLIVAFQDGSRQDEKFQIEQLDMLKNETVKLADSSIEISAIMYPPLPKRIASLTASQCGIFSGCDITQILIRQNCSDEKIKNLKEYWEPRIGKDAVRDSIDHFYCVQFD